MSFWNKEAKPLIGQKNVKYGLQSASTSKEPANRKKLSIFGDDADAGASDGNVNAALRAQAGARRSDSKYEKLHAAALAEDASVYDYDSFHDGIHADREAQKLAAHSKELAGPRYIHALQAAAKDREREQNIVYERRLERDRKVEDALHGDKEVFVTNAYKQKLLDDQLWQASQASKDISDEKNSARAKGNMHGMLNLLSTAMLEPEAQQAKSKAPHDAAERSGDGAAAPSTSEQESVARGRQGGAKTLQADLQKRADVKIQKAVADMDKYELARHRAEQRLLERASQRAEPSAALPMGRDTEPGPGGVRDGGAVDDALDAPQLGSGREAADKRSDGDASRASGADDASREAGDADGKGNLKRRADAAALSAAKERYLARKNARLA